MHKFCSFISLLLFSNISLGMEIPVTTQTANTQNTQEKRTVTYSSRINDQRKKQEAIRSLPSIRNSVKSGGITKPHRIVEQKKPASPFIYDAYTARRGEPKMLDIHCDDCGDLLIKYQKDGPGRLLRCYLDRIHSQQPLKDRQYAQFNVRTSPNLSCQNQACRLIIGRPMIYPSETRPAYKMDNRCFYIRESK